MTIRTLIFNPNVFYILGGIIVGLLHPIELTAVTYKKLGGNNFFGVENLRVNISLGVENF